MGKAKCVLYGLQNISELTSLLGNDINNPIYERVTRTRSAYNIFFQSSRKIEAPINSLKIIQRQIFYYLKPRKAPEYLYTFGSAIGNAAAHFESSHLTKLDISHFFPSCKSGRVFNLFRERYACSTEVSSKLTDLLTVSGHLPTGAPSSPILAFLAYKPMWERAYKLCAKYSCKLTVYMDDLTLSGSEIRPEMVKSLIALIEKEGFIINRGKTVHYNPDEERIVTGVLMTVRDKFDILPELRKKQAEIEYLLESNLRQDEEHKLLLQKQGIDSYSKQVARQGQLLTRR